MTKEIEQILKNSKTIAMVGVSSLKKAYAYTRKMITLHMMSMDAREGISAFVETRRPSWKNK